MVKNTRRTFLGGTRKNHRTARRKRRRHSRRRHRQSRRVARRVVRRQTRKQRRRHKYRQRGGQGQGQGTQGDTYDKSQSADRLSNARKQQAAPTVDPRRSSFIPVGEAVNDITNRILFGREVDLMEDACPLHFPDILLDGSAKSQLRDKTYEQQEATIDRHFANK